MTKIKNRSREGHHYTLDNAGRFWRTKEAPWVDLPCTIKSDSGGWHVAVKTLADLRSCLERHHSENGVAFDLESVWAWAAEREQERQKDYSAFMPTSKHATRGILDEGFLIH